MPYFRTTQQFAPGDRLGHDRIGPCGVAMGHDRIGLADILFFYLITVCSHYKNQVNVGITYIPSADLHYRLVEFYGLSTINSFLNIKNGIVFFNTLIINFHIYTIIYIMRKYVMNQTNTHNNYIIYTYSKMPREVISC